MADMSRNYSGGRFALELDGQVSALVKKLDGGGFTTDVAVTKLATSKVAQKSIGGITFDPFTAEVGLSMGQPLLDWINASFRGEHLRKAGAVIAADADNAARSRRDFTEALITEVGFPASDASAKETGNITIKWQAEKVDMSGGGGEKLQGNLSAKQKLFLPSNFRFEMGGLPCQSVSKIDAFTFKQAAVQDPIGDARIYQYTAGATEFPNIKVTFGMRDYDKWQAWFTDFVIKGNCAQENEVTGSLTWLSQNREKELARVTFKQCGIFKLSENANEAGKDGIKQGTAEIYCEEMEFEVIEK